MWLSQASKRDEHVLVGRVLCSLQVQQKWCCCVMGWSVMKPSILSALLFLFKQYLMETGCAKCVSTKGQWQLALASWARKSYHLNWFLLPRRLRQFYGASPSEFDCLTSSKGRNLQYLIKWSSLSHRQDTWVWMYDACHVEFSPLLHHSQFYWDALLLHSKILLGC